MTELDRLKADLDAARAAFSATSRAAARAAGVSEARKQFHVADVAYRRAFEAEVERLKAQPNVYKTAWDAHRAVSAAQAKENPNE